MHILVHLTRLIWRIPQSFQSLEPYLHRWRVVSKVERGGMPCVNKLADLTCPVSRGLCNTEPVEQTVQRGVHFDLLQVKEHRRWGFNPWIGEIPWRRKPAPGSLPGKSHGQRRLAGYSPKGCQESDTTKQLSTSTSSTCMLCDLSEVTSPLCASVSSCKVGTIIVPNI